MCGIAGYFAFSGLVENTEDLRRMNAAVAHRGPDGEGLTFIRRDAALLQNWQGKPTPMTPGDLPEWKAADFPHDLALGHRRFAIIDLSPGGHQPFLSRDKSLALTFNGEIYNYVELRQELERAGQVFHTQSDAEVFLLAYRQWGEACFARLRGFWALALWDSQKGLLLSSDRLGKVFPKKLQLVTFCY